MAILTSIIGTALISNAPSVLNGNFNALNLQAGDNSGSIVALKSSLARKITISSTAGTSLALTTGPTDKVMVWARGTLTGSATSGSVAVIYNGVTKDAATVKQAAAGDETSFALMYSETPGAATQNVTVSVIANGALTINNPRILAEIIT